MIPLDGIKPLLAIVTSKCVYILFVDNCGGEGTLRDVHWSKILPLILVDVVHLAAIQKDVLDAVITTHHIDKATINDRGMLFATLVHGMKHLDFTFSVNILVNSS